MLLGSIASSCGSSSHVLVDAAICQVTHWQWHAHTCGSDFAAALPWLICRYEGVACFTGDTQPAAIHRLLFAAQAETDGMISSCLQDHQLVARYKL
jgi:hypothetical protein